MNCLYNNELISVRLQGHIAQDVTAKEFTTKDGKKFFVGYLSVASNRRFKKGDELVTKTIFKTVKVKLSSMTEGLAKFLKKGVAINVEGYLDSEEWTGKDNSKNYREVIIPYDGALSLSGTPKEDREKNKTQDNAADVAPESFDEIVEPAF